MSQYPECRHVMPSGLHCQSPAMRGSSFCYYHSRPVRPVRPRRPSEEPIGLPFVLEASSCLEAINEVIQALAGNRISNRRAAILLHSIQMVKSPSPDGPFDLPLEDDDAPAELPPPGTAR
jgi:hypothetical protein